MSKPTSRIQIESAAIRNNETSGQLDFDFKGGGKQSELSVKPFAAVRVLNLLLLRLMQRTEPEVIEGLQTFAIAEIAAKRTMDGQLYLQYKMENGLAFGSGLEREKLEALHRQLSEVLAIPANAGPLPGNQ